MHSLFGASKVAADVLVQEYGRYFGMPTVCFRGGCLTGPHHSGAELHGFLAYLAARRGRRARRTGSTATRASRSATTSTPTTSAPRSMAFAERPRPGAVYNLGGGRENSVSMLEAIERLEELLGTRLSTEYVEEPRRGDHICYISDLRRLRADYPDWDVSIGARRDLRAAGDGVPALRMTDVLVTGGAGFIGSHLCAALVERGDAVVALDDLSTGLREHVPESVELVTASVTDAAEVDAAVGRGYEAVLHVAGQASIFKSFDDPERDLRTNVLGTLNVIEACVAHGVERLIFAGSMTVYGEPEHVPTPEREPCVPVSYYGVTKYAASGTSMRAPRAGSR